jgi:hypothetical protein
VPVDELLDDHAAEFEECRRWASSDAGQQARAQNPAGFANVRAHAAEHAAALARLSGQSLAARESQAALRLRVRPGVTPPPPPAALERGPGDHWVTIDSRHVLIRESQGKQSPQVQPVARPPALGAAIGNKVTIFSNSVAITYDPSLSAADQLIASKAIADAADLLNKNTGKLTADEKTAIAQISSFVVIGSGLIGATGNGSMTLSIGYMEAPGTSAAWLGSLFGHEGQHYLNSGKYFGPNLWRSEQSASQTQLAIGRKIGLTPAEVGSLQDWSADSNRQAMQEHMMKGYRY